MPIERRPDRQRDDRNVKRNQVEERTLNVLKDMPTFADGFHNRREVVVEQHEIRRRAGHIGAPPAHGDADVGPTQSGRVVDAVAGHRNDGASVLQPVDDQELLFGTDPRKNGSAADPRHPFGVAERGQVVSRDDQTIVVQDAGGLGHGVRRQRVVAGNHRDANAGALTLGHRPGHLGPQWVLESPTSRRP